jgi:hypothetical protein
MHYLNTGFEILGLLLGALLIYIALFLTESEEKTIENHLEEWWIIIKDAQIRSKSGLTAFYQVIAKVSSDCIDRIYGPKLQAWKVLTGSLAVYVLLFIAIVIIQIPVEAMFQALYLGGLLTLIALGRLSGELGRQRICHKILMGLFVIGASGPR